MMNGKELRLGNMIRCTHHLPIGYRVPLLLHTTVTEIRTDMVGTGEGFYKFTDIAPITLNTEILLKTDAQRISDTEFILSRTTADEPDIYIQKDMNQFYLSTDTGCKCSVAILYLHQLQNLYFALIGKELKINI